MCGSRHHVCEAMIMGARLCSHACGHSESSYLFEAHKFAPVVNPRTKMPSNMSVEAIKSPTQKYLTRKIHLPRLAAPSTPGSLH